MFIQNQHNDIKSESNYFVSASQDKTLKIWDIRKHNREVYVTDKFEYPIEDFFIYEGS